MEQFQKNVTKHETVKTLNISTSSTVYNIFRRFRESGEMSVRKVKDQQWMLMIFGPSGSTPVKTGLILSWTPLRGSGTLPQITAGFKNTAGLKNISRNQWAKAGLKWTESIKLFYGQKNQNFKFFVGASDTVSLGLKTATLRPDISSHLGRCGAAHIWRGFRPTSCPIQTSLSGKDFHVSAGQ